MSVQTEYIAGKGVMLTVQTPTEGFTILLSDQMTVGAIEHYLKNLRDWLGEDIAFV